MSTAIDIAALFAPKATDVPYVCEDELVISLILRTDSYKFGHPFAYPKKTKKRRIIGMSSYGEARVPSSQTIVPFGEQIFNKKYLSKRITMAHIDEAEKFALAHFGRPLFARKDWEKVVTVYGGYLPLIIRSVREGTPVRGGIPLYSVTVLDEDLYWMSSGIEMSKLRSVWYPTTIATFDREIKLEIKRYFEISGADPGLIPFALHDFGGRGVTCGEQAEIGGAAHLVNFMGSDTVEGVLAANFFYRNPMAAFSVFATEHSVECSFGLDVEGEIAYLKQQLEMATPGMIISIVIDGKDAFRCAEALCTGELRDLIIAAGKTGAKVVFRPDSGDMLETIPRILQLQEAAFGSDTNAKGYRKINYVGIIQGDGIDRQGMAIKAVYGKILSMGFSADNVIFGSGGGLLQGVTRDSLKFAQKASAILVEETAEDGTVTRRWIGIAKDPVTDPGKKSKEGVMTAVRSKMTGELMAARLDQHELNEEFEDIHVLTYHTGTLYNETILDEVRERAE
jgi:nicotinamide phosphoribosyltransferase